MKCSQTSALAIFVVTLGGFSPSLHATEYFVAQAGQTPSDYRSWETAASNIADAVALAVNGDTVWVDAGNYPLAETLLITQNISLRGTNGTVTLDGSGTVRCLDMPSATATLANLTFANGYTTGSGGGVSLCNGTVTNCVFFNNTAVTNGGGAYAGTPGTAKFYDCRFVGNHSATTILYNGGGGAYAANAQQFYRCEFTNNTAAGYGGGGNAENKQQFYDCRFEDNLAFVSGGGLYFRNGSGEAGGLVTNCTFRSNVASNSYGGVYMYYVNIFDSLIQSNRAVTGDGGGLGIGGPANFTLGVVTNCIISDNTGATTGGATIGPYGALRNCRILRNHATGGTWSQGAGGVTFGTGARMDDCIVAENIGDLCPGGVIGSYGTPLKNSLIRNNKGYSAGGVFLLYGASIESCTIAGNQGGGGYSGGIYNRGINADQVTFYNTIIYGNVAGVNSNYYLTSGRPVAFTNCCFAPALTEQAVIDNSFGNVISAPRFVDAAGSNYHLRSSSPCFNTGLNRSWMTGALDLDRNPRIRYGQVDMGCFEALLLGSLLQIR